jgi:hypothetical protein
MGKCKIYFNEDTEKGIIEYNSTNSRELKNNIFKEKLQIPFEKLAENIINTYKFPYIDVSKINLQAEVVSELIEKIDMYKEDKGKAFSYFTTIAKNYLIRNNNLNYKNIKQNSLISQIPDEFDSNIENTYDYDDFIKFMFKYWENNLEEIFLKKRDQRIVNSILNLFINCNDIKIFNKKNLYFLIKNTTNSKTKYITNVINIMKTHQVKILNNYLEHYI